MDEMTTHFDSKKREADKHKKEVDLLKTRLEN